MKIKQLFFILLFLVNLAKAGFVGTRLLGALGIAAVGSKISQTFYKNKVLKKQKAVVLKEQKFQDLKESFGHNWQGDWLSFPNMAEKIRQVLQKYNLQPKDFDFEITDNFAFNSESKNQRNGTFKFKKTDLIFSELYIQNNGGEYKADNAEMCYKIAKDYATKKMVNIFLAKFKHELQHYFDKDITDDIYKEFEIYFILKYKNDTYQYAPYTYQFLMNQEFSNFIRSNSDQQKKLHELELRADILSQDDPQEIRDFAEYFKVNGSGGFFDPQHPDDQIRHDNLIKKAEQLEKEAALKKEQELKKLQEQKQFEERCLIVL